MTLIERNWPSIQLVLKSKDIMGNGEVSFDDFKQVMLPDLVGLLIGHFCYNFELIHLLYEFSSRIRFYICGSIRAGVRILALLDLLVFEDLCESDLLD